MIKDIRVENRPRERLIKNGKKSLSDTEILAIIINTGTKKHSALELAEMILNKYTFKELMNISYEELISFSGIKASKATKIIASFEMARRSLIVDSKKIVLNDPKTIYNYMKSDYIYETKEVFYVLILDCKCNLLKKIKMSEGSSSSVGIELQELIRQFYKYNAYGFILVHNHPSGDINPSLNDKRTTSKIRDFTRELGFYLLDHIIFSIDKYYSFAENNLLE